MKDISSKDPVGAHTLQVISKADQFNSWMFDQLKNSVSGNILEIGSGIGNLSNVILDNGLSMTLSDYNEDYVNELRGKFNGHPRVKRIMQLDLLEPDFYNLYNGLRETFDTILLLNVIEHIDDDIKALDNCCYLLKKGGNIIILAPAHQWLYCRYDKELGHHRRYTKKTLATTVTSAGFQIKNIRFFNLIGIAGWLMLGKFLKRKQLYKTEMNVFDKLVPVFKLFDTLTFKKAGLSLIAIATKP